MCVCVHVNNRLSRTQTAAPDISWTERIVSRRLALQLRLGVPRRLPLPPHRTQIGFHIPFHGLPSTAVISCGTWLVYQGRSFLFLLFPPFFLNTFNPDKSHLLFKCSSSIQLSIRCTRTVVLSSSGAQQYGPPRLNVEQLVEPLNYLTQRTNVGGFCPNGTIAKEGTHSNTDYIDSIGACEIHSTDLDIAKLLCSSGTSQAGVPGCQIIWCKSVRTDWSGCVSDIASYGWAATYCASKTVPSQEAAQCNGGNCQKCLSDIADFGWASAISAWGSVVSQGGQCTSQNLLPKALIECQDGVNIQYFSGGQWNTYLAVPSTATLCGGKVSFNSTADSVMFQYPIRVSQCSQVPGCLTVGYTFFQLLLFVH